MKKLIYINLIGVILINNAMAQPPTIKEATDTTTAVHELKKKRILPPEEPIKFRLSTMAGINFSFAGHQISDATNSSFDQTFEKTSIALKPCIDYFFTPKIGVGISYNYSEYKLHAESFVGGEYASGSLIFFLYGSSGYIPYYDYVDLKTSVNILSTHAVYKLTQYNRDKRQLWEITTRGGISISFIEEEQDLMVAQKMDPYGNGSYNYFEQSRALFSFRKTAGSVFLNLQVALHVTKYFSFIMADFTQNFGIINPTIPQTSVTNSDGKTVTANKHKVTPSGFALATGFSASF